MLYGIQPIMGYIDIERLISNFDQLDNNLKDRRLRKMIVEFLIKDFKKICSKLMN
jgi:Ca2+-binding EF-hand superfamily protein